MSELAALMTLYGQVDDIVVENPGLAPHVGAFLPAYRHGAAGWYEVALRWGRDGAAGPRRLAVGDRAVDRPPLDGAFAELNTIPPGELASERLLAVALLARVSPHVGPSPAGISRLSRASTHAELADALVPIVHEAVTPGRAVSSLSARARAGLHQDAVRLVALLGDTAAYPDIRYWPAMMNDALHQQLVPAAVARVPMKAATWTIIPSTPGHGPAAAFETRLRVPGATLADIDAILHPDQWTKCTPWCAMDAQAPDPSPGVHRFLEVLAVDCASLAGGPGTSILDPFFKLLQLKTVLDFKPAAGIPPANGAAVEYRMADDQGLGDGLVSVDEGSLLIWQGVSQGQSEVRVVTTKRIQFGFLTGMSDRTAAQLAHLVWLLGYIKLAEHFITSIAGQFVIHEEGPQSGPPGTGAQQIAAAVEEALDECFTGMCGSFAKIAAGEYGTAAYVGDLAKLSKHLTCHGSRLLKIGASLVSAHSACAGTSHPPFAPHEAPVRTRIG